MCKRRAYSRIVVVVFALLLPVTSCTKKLKLPDVGAQGKIVLMGELVAGDTVAIRGGQSIAVAAGSSMSYTLPQQLLVSLTDTAGNAYSLNGVKDALADMLHTIQFSSATNIKAACLYRLQAIHPQLGVANCTVNVPAPFIAKLVDTATVIVNGLSLMRARIQIYDDGNTTNYYSVEGVKQRMNVDGVFSYNNQNYTISQYRALYDSLKNAGVLLKTLFDTTYLRLNTRVNIYTDDEKTENLKLGNAQSASRRILLSDKAINGQIYTLQVYLDKTLFVSDDSLRGEVQIKIKSISEDYFRYLKSYELFLPAGSFNSLAQPISFEGNVQNGVGMVGGVYLITYRYLFDRWY